MTFVKVVEECGAWRIHTLAGNVIGPRLHGARPPEGLPPLQDIFETKSEAQAAAMLWNTYAHWVAANRKKKRR
jgi:hypothetical protein